MRKIERPRIERPQPVVVENNNTVQRTGGISLGLGGILTIIFVIAQLAGVIEWSWWWVFAPLWIPPAFFLGIILIPLTIAGVLILFWAIGKAIEFLFKKIRNVFRKRK